MESLLHSDESHKKPATFAPQAMWFALHAMLALASWLALMLVGYAVSPVGVSQTVILLLFIDVTYEVQAT